MLVFNTKDIYTVSREVLFLPCHGYLRVVSPGEKFLYVILSLFYRGGSTRGICFRLIEDLANYIFFIETKYGDKIVKF